MSDTVPPSMKALGEAIAQHPDPVQTALCGFDLWIELLGSKYVQPCHFGPGGQPVEGEPPEGGLVVPVPAIRGTIVVSFDPSLPPDGFELRP